MTMTTRTLFAGACKHATPLLVTLLAACAAGDPDELPQHEVLLPSVAAGDVLRRGLVEVLAPEPGITLSTAIMYEDGHDETYEIETLPDGTVVERYIPEIEHGDEDDIDFADDGEVGAAASSACSQSSYSFFGGRWGGTYNWYFNSSSTPSYLSSDGVVGALRGAINNITQSRNSCGWSDKVGARAAYQGRRARSVNVSRGGSCTSPDGVNMVGFGDLPRGTLAVACKWSSGNRAVEADVRINKVDHRWYVRRPSGCYGRHDIQSVMTHEFGHVFGLGHSNGSAQTMYHSIAACNNSKRTLGRGDMIGLRRRY